jgi:c-di-GMP-binding flagellar brake protein YcgR
LCEEINPLPQQERRRYYRIRDTLAIEYELLSTEEYEKEKTLLQSQPSGLRILKNKYADFLPQGLDLENLGGGENETIRGLLKLVIHIHEKVDLILFHLEKRGNLSIYQKTPQKISLGAEGIGFSVDEPVPVGSLIRMKILLPQSPQILITALARVIHMTPKGREGKNTNEGHRFDVGITFTDIHEDDQEAMIKYIFRRQRDMLRSRGKG